MLSLPQLASAVNDWCAEHQIEPANGQAGELVTERNIRFYRTLGLVDPPEGAAYGEKHLLQLSAIRLLQAQGVPLRRIRDLLYGRSLSDLREIRKRGLAESSAAQHAAAFPMPVPGGEEVWRMIPLDEDFLIVSRRGATLSPDRRAAVLRALRGEIPSPSRKNKTRS
jgi:DNA-binding transcriptional MerR regulator